MRAQQKGSIHHKGGKAINIFANRLVMIGIRTAHHQIGRYDIIRVGSHAELFQNGKTAGIRGRNFGGLFALEQLYLNIFVAHHLADMAFDAGDGICQASYEN